MAESRAALDTRCQQRARRKVEREGLPFVTLKAAVTLDGRTAARSGESKWITGPEARKEAHRLRVLHDAILVGVGTVLADDPELTVRAVRGKSPLRVVLDSRLRTPLTAKLVTGAAQVPTLILHARSAPAVRVTKLRAAGVQLASVRRGRGGVGLDIEAALRELARRGVVQVLVEGGAHIHAALLDAGLVDHAAVFVAPKILGDASAFPLASGRSARSLPNAFELAALRVSRCGNDVLFRGDIAATVRAPERRSGRNSPGPRRRTTL
ncbi:MAG: bifunctional diaminohydroxyphosphoribosylaminopyrimidine deaminase/5-amino-6-(5-phosphoribosylamino)uracil reductase RibD [Polyangiales bacterium]